MEKNTLLSVGIDIGTTTTQLVFSSLTVINASGPTQAPRYAIVGRRVLYESPVVMTPMHYGHDGRRVLDGPALAALVRGWYTDAGLTTHEVTTGAAIITGESLKAGNARQTIMQLTDSLGDFVVATAGPHLESVIAAKGSGAAALASRNKQTVLNIDIGGGTANYAVFCSDTLLDTACIAIGGRLIETNAQGVVTRVHPPAAALAETLTPRQGEVTREMLPRIADRMADLLYDTAKGLPCPLARSLLQTPPLRAGYTFDAVTVSGGVGFCLEHPPADLYCYHDMGPLLAKAIKQHPGFSSLPLVSPATTVRATVIGAGSWALSLSGSTIWADSAALPLRNIPVLSMDIDWAAPPEQPEALFTRQFAVYDLAAEDPLFAFYFRNVPETYASVQYLARHIAAFWRSFGATRRPLVVALQEDLGKSLGMELRPMLPQSSIVIIDEVSLHEGDYIDIGSPRQRGGYVPIVIKSLAFFGG